jgi:hypothetical protein
MGNWWLNEQLPPHGSTISGYDLQQHTVGQTIFPLTTKNFSSKKLLSSKKKYSSL